MKNLFFELVIFLALFFAVSGCKKEAGEGGNSSISGKVYVRDYNTTFIVLQYEYYGPDVDVYIIYGDDKSYSERIRTSYDGTYEFKYLRPGKYHIYAYSKDSTLQTSSEIAKLVDVEISDKKQEVTAPLITILK